MSDDPKDVVASLKTHLTAGTLERIGPKWRLSMLVKSIDHTEQLQQAAWNTACYLPKTDEFEGLIQTLKAVSEACSEALDILHERARDAARDKIADEAVSTELAKLRNLPTVKMPES